MDVDTKIYNEVMSIIMSAKVHMDAYGKDAFSHIVSVVSLPSGAKQVIVDSNMLYERTEYMLAAYDEKARLKNAPAVVMVGIMYVSK